MNKENHDKAWRMLQESGMKLGNMMVVRSNFTSVYKDEFPFIEIRYEKGEVKYYHSSIKEISNLMFTSKKEVILANAIYENVKDNLNINDFMGMLKFTFRILNVKSEWSK